MARVPRFATPVLLAAAVYNIVWGSLVVLLPLTTLGWLMTPEEIASIGTIGVNFWQCIGMIVGVYGVGYWVAAADPIRHWPIVLVGFLGKIFGPIGFAFGLIQGTVPTSFGWTILPNDLIWWIPFGAILISARRAPRSGSSPIPAPRSPDALA